jgi:hypothetical protein
MAASSTTTNLMYLVLYLLIAYLIFGFNQTNMSMYIVFYIITCILLFTIDLSKYNLYLILYGLASTVALVYGTKAVYATGELRGGIFAVGTFLVLAYFGIRWFSTKNKMPSTWPPVINMCPDYLTYVAALPGCVDMSGVTTSSSGLVKTNPSDVATLQLSNTQKVFEFTSADVKAAQSVKDLQKICDRCQTAGLTWEGVYDGDVCVGISKNEAARAASDAAGCSA